MGKHLRDQNGIKITLSTKLIVSIVLLECLLMSAIILVVEKQMRASILDEFRKRGLSVTKNLAAINSNFVTTYNYVNIEQNVERVVNENGLLYAAVLFYDGEVAAYSGRKDLKDGVLSGQLHERTLGVGDILIQNGTLESLEFYDIAVPIILKKENWGTVRTGMSLSGINDSILKVRKYLLSLGGMALIFGCLSSLILARSITRPVAKLVHSVDAVSSGDYEHPIQIQTRDEIGYLGKRFATMQQVVKKHVNLLVDANTNLSAANESLKHEIAERKQVEKSLHHRDGILEAMTYSTERFLKDRLWHENIQEVLDRLGRTTGVRRLYISEYPSSDKTHEREHIFNSEWIAPRVIPEVNVLNDQPSSSEDIESNHCRELIEEQKRNPIRIEPSHETEHGNIPIYVGERQWGILGYERCEINSASSTAAFDAIKTVAGNLGAAIQQKLTLERLEDANRLKDDFLANMSHELRTPLNHVIGFTELVVDKHFGDLNETQEEYLKDVVHSSRHLLSLINDILDISKIETGRLSLELSVVDLRSLIENSIKVLQPESLKHGVPLDTDIGDISAYITADQRKLEQILYNLLSNGLKFTPEGGKVCLTTRQVYCHVRQARRSKDGNNRLIVAVSSETPEDLDTTKRKAIKFSISDTGIGIEQEDQKRIFNSFEQVDGSSSRQYGGAGLGLSLAQRLVELHGGRIWVDSEGTGKGSTFSFVIPV